MNIISTIIFKIGNKADETIELIVRKSELVEVMIIKLNVPNAFK